MWIFLHQQAEKSLQNQHVLSILQVGSHQLQYRFIRTSKPKSRYKTNTFCPLTQKSLQNQHVLSYNPGMVCRPKSRPPRRKTAKMGGCGRGPGSWARLLAALTLQCAAKPYWWHGGQPAQVATSRVNVRMKRPRHPLAGPRPPPIGLTCASKGPRAQDAFTETEGGLTARRPPSAFHISRDATEAGPRRVPPSLRAVAAPSALKSHPPGNT